MWDPLKYTDPDGEWVNFVIGGVMGGISGILTAQSAGYDFGDWELWAYSVVGSGIGVLSAGVGSALASESYVLAATASGAVSGAGMSTMSAYAGGARGGELIEAGMGGAFKGGLTGFAGGTVGGAIGGGWGAFAGGATAGGLGTAMSGGSGEDILMGAALGGASSYGMYHLQGEIGYYKYRRSGVTFDGKTLSYRQFMGMSADFQRSKFWGREFGGYLLEGGGYKHSYGTHPLLNPEGATRCDLGGDLIYSTKTWASFHAHWGEPEYHSPRDYKFDSRWMRSSFVINKYNASFNYYPPPHTGGGYTTTFTGNFYRYPYYFGF